MNAPQEASEKPGTTEKIKEHVEGAPRDSSKTMAKLKRKPALGVILAGGLGVVAANVIGVGEVAIALAAGYAAYRVLTA